MGDRGGGHACNQRVRVRDLVWWERQADHVPPCGGVNEWVASRGRREQGEGLHVHACACMVVVVVVVVVGYMRLLCKQLHYVCDSSSPRPSAIHGARNDSLAVLSPLPEL